MYALNIGNPPICSFYELLFWPPDSGPQQKELKIVTIYKQSSEKYSVRVVLWTVFLDKKTTKIWVRESKNSNVRIFENFRLLSGRNV